MRKYKLFIIIYLLLHVLFSTEGTRSLCSDTKENTFLGPEDTPTDIITPTEEACRARCKLETTCNAWSWQIQTKKCFLFETKTEIELPGFTSGDKICQGDVLANFTFRFMILFILFQLICCNVRIIKQLRKFWEPKEIPLLTFQLLVFTASKAF